MTVKFSVYIQPGARQTGFAGYFDGKPKIKIKSPARDNQANRELLAFLAKKLGVSKAVIEISQGLASRHKLIGIDTALSTEEIVRKLAS